MISSIDLFFDDEIEEDQLTNVIKIRKSLRNKSGLFALPHIKIVSIFRINKDGLRCLLDSLNGKFKPSVRTSSIPLILKLCAALRFFGSGSYQQSIGDDFNIGMAQPTVSLILKEVVTLFEAHLCQKWITLPNETEKLECKISFMRKNNIPGVVGCVDGTHIKIIAPNKTERHLYYNRKGYYSLNTMIICDHNLCIRCVDARYPGANHDSFVWNHSTINTIMAEKYQNGERNSWLLGDSGYPLLPCLITPFRQAAPESREARFNKIHSSARNIVERTIGVLKSRFRCLLAAREMHYNPEKTKQIINSCCVLHNMCIYYKVQNEEGTEEFGEGSNIDLSSESEQSGLNSNMLEEGKRIRNDILNSIL